VTWEGVRPLASNTGLNSHVDARGLTRSLPTFRHFGAARKSDGRSQRAVASCTKRRMTAIDAKYDPSRCRRQRPRAGGGARCLPPVLPPPVAELTCCAARSRICRQLSGAAVRVGDPLCDGRQTGARLRACLCGKPLRQVADALGYLGGCAIACARFHGTLPAFPLDGDFSLQIAT